MFQSPQWGDNSKDGVPFFKVCILEFQSPQWGDNSKVKMAAYIRKTISSFSPRNGEIILKVLVEVTEFWTYVWRFSPRNGEIILKL